MRDATNIELIEMVAGLAAACAKLGLACSMKLTDPDDPSIPMLEGACAALDRVKARLHEVVGE